MLYTSTIRVHAATQGAYENVFQDCFQNGMADARCHMPTQTCVLKVITYEISVFSSGSSTMLTTGIYSVEYTEGDKFYITHKHTLTMNTHLHANAHTHIW